MARLCMLLPMLAFVATTMLCSGASAANTCAGPVEQIQGVAHDKSVGLVQGKSVMQRKKEMLEEDTEDDLPQDEEAGSETKSTDQENVTA
mmetsp:Transcript_99649/g.197552  ORF Transcript_99649/g.197552 Transcript_99649/m.197552 type:complete len:90 (+) Transcript_99649:93-362(+)|eukprot:CAMPEP_0172675804 /NCGR_PEP_ID=MMETSP1074-20121228/13505_1 /TAXON_ID=2916 /ORGANISM="Ceratium fusus, Strain PA161109" /LENGTH=89 /DNA_ID=CAMNT_0013493311 /DNA_START=82 /DNA_END=351 /DNA_ORIENTATION=+